jgi:hypothetical protein
MTVRQKSMEFSLQAAAPATGGADKLKLELHAFVA